MGYFIVYAIIMCIIEYALIRFQLKFEHKKLYISIAVAIAAISVFTTVLIIKDVTKIYSYGLLSFFSILLYLAVEDAVTMKIDKIAVIVLLAVGCIVSFCIPDVNIIEVIIFTLILTVVMSILSIKSKEGIGKGDVLCVCALSLCFTMNNVFSCMIYSLLMSMIYSIVQICRKKQNKKTPIPFIPFMVLGMIVTVCYF